MQYGYVWEKLHLAVLGLARSTTPLADRLADAYRFHLLHLSQHELPEDIREDYARVRDALRRTEATGDEGRAMASARALDEGEVYDLLERIVSMYDRVAKYGPNG